MNIPDCLNHLRPGAEWALTSNDYSTLEWSGPGEPPTLAELETAWQQIQNHKIWPDVQALMAAFTMQEMAAISLSVDPITAGLRLQLASWRSPVDPSHELVQTGLNNLVAIGILTAERKAEIIATASAS
jgi:hypothetical protein